MDSDFGIKNYIADSQLFLTCIVFYFSFGELPYLGLMEISMIVHCFVV